MNVNGFNRVSYDNQNRSGVVPSRLQARRDAQSVDQLAEIESRKSLATEINRSLQHYQEIVSPAVGHDNGQSDNNSTSGKVAMYVKSEGSLYDVYTEFTANAKAANQPITRAQVRRNGEASEQFNLQTDAAGLVTIKMLDPLTRAALSVEIGPDGKVTAKRG